MGAAEMVGSIALTFFCNKCVELFLKFNKDGVLTDELGEACRRGIRAFQSLKWPNGGDLVSDEKVPLFNTSEEIKSFERAMRSQSESISLANLDNWVRKIQSILDDNVSVEEKKRTAQELKTFFDTLGDCSFYATRESLRSSVTMAGM
jgi:hypothetical protein